MKYCPSCQSTYTDESLRFCLQDGTGLVGGDSGNYRTQELDERETVVRKNPVTFDLEQDQVFATQPEVKRSNPLLIAILTALGMCVVFGGIAAVLLLVSYSSSTNDVSNLNSNHATPIVMPTMPANANSGVDGWTVWQPIDPNASLNGERLTYYRGTTAQQCQADCEADPKCRGFGLVRQGFYNPEDPPMCYLLSKVTSSTPSACCISGVKK